MSRCQGVALESISTVDCPECGTACPADPRYVTWCDACGWNVTPVVTRSQSETARRIGAWMDASLLAEAETRHVLRRFRIAASAYATVVYGVVLALLAGGVTLVVAAFPNPFALVFGGLLIGVAIVARPRVPSMPEGVVDRSQLPALYALADRVADAMGAHHVDGIVIDDRFNASFGRYEWRGRRVMRLGLPLAAISSGQQLVALIAHEIAHDVNRDPVRGRYIGNAYRALLELYAMVLPTRLRPTLSGDVFQAEATGGSVLTNTVLRVVSRLARPFVTLFEVLMRRDSQRAEYLADALAADVAGIDAARGMLRLSHLEPMLITTAGAIVTTRGSADELFDQLRDRMAHTPAREWQRLDRVMALEQTQLDSTHPPTAQRIRVIAGRPPAPPRVELEPQDEQAVKLELVPLERPYSRELVARARDRLYR